MNLNCFISEVQKSFLMKLRTIEKIEIINYIKAPAAKVYEVLTTEKGLGVVWTPSHKVKPELGFINEFDFNEQPGE